MSYAIKRLATEHRTMMDPANRVCDVYAEPLEDNIYEWHFTIKGPGDPKLAYKDGIYHGILKFPRSYPFAPPDIIFYTPNGRFDLNKKICSTISSYHPERWRPTYDVSLILVALRLFMAQENEPGNGAVTMIPFAEKTKMAKESWSFKCSGCGCSSQEVWEEHMKMYPETSMEKESQVPSASSAPGNGQAGAAESSSQSEAAGGKDELPEAPADSQPGTEQSSQEDQKDANDGKEAQALTPSPDTPSPDTRLSAVSQRSAPLISPAASTTPERVERVLPEEQPEAVSDNNRADGGEGIALVPSENGGAVEEPAVPDGEGPQEEEAKVFELLIGPRTYQISIRWLDTIIVGCVVVIGAILTRRAASLCVQTFVA